MSTRRLIIGFANSWDAAWTTVLGRLRFALDDLRLPQPAMEIAGDFTDKRFAQSVQISKELVISSIKLVERPRAYPDPVGKRVLDLADGDLRFGLKLNFVGNVVSSSRSIFSPVLGQVHSAIQEALKTGSRICQVNTDGAVLNLATVAVILSRRANGVVSALASPRFIITRKKSLDFGTNLSL